MKRLLSTFYGKAGRLQVSICKSAVSFHLFPKNDQLLTRYNVSLFTYPTLTIIAIFFMFVIIPIYHTFFNYFIFSI